jgi:UDP-N-acetyl-2-amino-2-deoxyglucuronate dehydrogenase
MANQIDVGVLTQLDGAHLAEYFDSLAKTPEVRRVAVADSDGKYEAAARAALGDKFAGFYTDHKKLLADFDPALALVTREPVASPPVIADALAAGCHVLTEKPACIAADDFAPLVATARAKHLHLMLALGNRPLAPVAEARRLVRRGLLGKIYGLSMFLVADQARLKRDDYRKQWRGYKARAGGGHLAWLGIHWLDLATYVTGLHVEQVAGFTEVVGGQPIDVEDSASVALRYSGGVLGTMLSGFYLDLKHKENVGKYHSHMQIWGEHGWLRLAVFEEEPMTWYSSLEPGPPQVQTFRYPKGDRSYLPLVRAAVRAAAGTDEPPITGEEGLEVLRTIYALYRAAETKRSQTVIEENR